MLGRRVGAADRTLVHHRVLFHRKRKTELVRLANRLAVTGMVVLGLAFTASVALVVSFVYSSVVATTLTTVTVVLFGATWFGLPLWLRERPPYRRPRG